MVWVMYGIVFCSELWPVTGWLPLLSHQNREHPNDMLNGLRRDCFTHLLFEELEVRLRWHEKPNLAAPNQRDGPLLVEHSSESS